MRKLRPSMFIQRMPRTMRLNAVIALTLIALVSPHRAVAEVDPLLHFIAAQQEATAAVYDRLSYSAVLKTKTLESFSDELLDQTFVITIERRGTSALYTCERSTVIHEIEQRENGKLLDPIFDVRKQPTVQRVLRTESFLASWPDVATPIATLYRAEDWDGSPNDPREGILTIWHGVDLRRHCFGLRNPFHELIKQPEHLARWELTKDADAIYRLSRWVAPGTPKERADLSITVGGEFGLMREAKFTPSGSTTECAALYQTVEIAGRSLQLPEQVQSISQTSEKKVTNESRVQFRDFTDHSELAPFVLKDLAMPEESTVVVALPAGEQTKHIWRGGELDRFPG